VEETKESERPLLQVVIASVRDERKGVLVADWFGIRGTTEQSFLRELRAQFDRRMAELREQLARGIIDEKEFRRRAAEAARAEAEARAEAKAEEKVEEPAAEVDELAFDVQDDYFEDEEEDEETVRRRAKQRRRQLVFDEEAGRMVAKRRRKGGRKRGKWEDFDALDDLDEFEDL